jgi:hypothetical protein
MKNKKLIFLPLLIIMVALVTCFGIAKALPYAPGQTLDPSCTPGSLNCFVLATSTSLQDLTIQAASGANSLFDVNSSLGATFLHVTSSGNFGVDTSTPGRTLTVAGDEYVTGIRYDSLNSAGSAGMLLQTTGSGSQWVATSTLGISGSLSGGTLGYVARWTSASSLSIGTLLDNSVVSGVNATSSTVNFLVQGTGSLNPLQVSSSSGASLLKIFADGGMAFATSTLDSPTTAAFAGQYYSAEFDNGTNTPGTIDWSKANVQRWVLNNSGTFVFTNYHPGGRYLLLLYQDGTGSRTVTWPGILHWSGGTAPTLTTAGGQMDIITFVCGPTNCYGGANLNYAP